MVMTSPGLDELTALLEKLRGREDAITRELERRHADVVSEIAAVEEAIRLLAAEHGVVSSPTATPTAPTGSLAAESAAQPSVTLPDAQAAPVVAQGAAGDNVAPSGAPVPTAAPASVSIPTARSRRVRGQNWQRGLAGLQQGDAAVRIAEQNGGIVTVAMLAQILVEVSLTRATGKLANGQANRVLATSSRFERVARGTYRLRAGSHCDAGSDRVSER